jgi:dihydrofolate reductase
MSEMSVIVAVSRTSLGIGMKGQLPWRLLSDMKRFRILTSTTTDPTIPNAVVMGHNTWKSLPRACRPLVGRFNIILTRDVSKVHGLSDPNVIAVSNLEEALEAASKCAHIFIIGGQHVYTEALSHPRCTRIYMTMIDGTYACDTFFPDIANKLGFVQASTSEQLTERDIVYRYIEYVRSI